MCLAQGHKVVTPVRLEHADPGLPLSHCATPFKSYQSETKDTDDNDYADNDEDGDMIPMCRSCFAGDTKKNVQIFENFTSTEELI